MKRWKHFNQLKETPAVIYVFKKLLAFCLLYAGSAVLGEALIIGGLSALGYDPLHGVMPMESWGNLLPYYGFVVFLLATVVYCRFVEKRPVKSMGLNKHIGDYLPGAVIAAVLLLMVVGVWILTGMASYEGINSNVDSGYLVGLLIGLVIQSAAEEVLSRGFLMSSLLEKTSVPVAVLLSATAFALPHFPTLLDSDTPFAVVGVINLYLISAVFSLLILWRSNLWIACGLHGIWNFLLYGVFGMTLSGSDAETAGIFLIKINAQNIVTGGEYGLEAGIACTVVLAAVVAILMLLTRKHISCAIASDK